MRLLRVALASTFALLLAAFPASAQQKVLPLWPHTTPEPAQTTDPEKDVTTDKDPLISGHRTSRITNVTHPTMSVYLPTTVLNSGAAALVFPGGSYVRLAWEGEGVDTCTWLNSLGIACLLIKYRVPEQGRYPANFADLEDAQQAMRLARQHATEWRIDPSRIGVIGFSAGANLAVLLSSHPDDTHVSTTPAAPDVDSAIDARANFAIIVYPAYLINMPEPLPNAREGTPRPTPPEFPTLNPIYEPNQFTPPTFLIQAENDRAWGRNAPVYYEALANANVPAELHIYASGGHGFGLHPVGRPEEHWTQLAAAWLRSNSIIPPFIPATRRGPNGAEGYSTPAPPCPNALPQPGRPDKTPPPPTDPACW
jgi:acetyl esterase/lipase